MIERLASKWLEITMTALVLYLVLSNAKGFSDIVSSLGSSFAGSVKVLQARG